MSDPRDLVRNAADPRQVKRAERKRAADEEFERAAYYAVLSSPEGRVVLWNLILSTGVFQRLWTASAEIHRAVGVRDFGLDLMKRLQLIDTDLFQLMEREWFARERRDQMQNVAAHTPSALGGVDDGT